MRRDAIVASGAALAAAVLLLAGCQEKVGSSSGINGSAPSSAPARRSRASARAGGLRPLNRWRLASGAALAAAVLLLAGCQEKVGSSSPFNVPWSSDMYVQPSVYPQEQAYDTPAGTVPVNPEPPALQHMVASEQLKNPVAMTKESLARGKVVYETFCTPCHGASGKGDGLVAPKFVPPPPLDGPAIKGRTDGYLYATVRLGSLSTLMPAYGYRMTEQQRWDVVNYVRSLQGMTAQADPVTPTRKAEAATAPEVVKP